MKPVELHDAAVFTCDDCGRDNFIHLITQPATAEEIEKLGASDADEDLSGLMKTSIPSEVECKFCRAKICSFASSDGRLISDA